jgi:hypothetical protein
MKRKISLFLAALMVVSSAAFLASCSGSEESGTDTTTDGGADTSAAATTTAAAATTSATTTTENSVVITPLVPDETYLVGYQAETEWHYKVFSAPYSSSGAGGTFSEDTDEFAAYQASMGWENGVATLPDGVIEDMATWPTASGAFGDRGNYDTDIGWSGDNHGLMLMATFDIDDLDTLKSSYENVSLWAFFDNTMYVYINGTLVFADDANCQSGDWNDAYAYLGPDGGSCDQYFEVEDLKDVLVQGTNTIVVTLKDCWGGREIELDLVAEND